MAQNTHNFATNPSVTATYAGEMALPYVYAATLSAPTLANGNVTILQNVRFKAPIPVMANTDLIMAGGCDFDNTATTTLTESVLEVQDLMVNLQLCKGNFRTWWQGDDYTINNGVPDDYADALLLYIAGEVQGTVERNIWQGDKTGAGTYALFDGLPVNWVANGGTASALTNVIDAVGSVIDGLAEVVALIPTNIVGDYENVNIYVNPQTIDCYNIAIGQLGGGYNNATSDGGQIRFGGYNLVSSPGLALGYFAVARAQDLAVGIGQADSVEMAQAIDMTPLDGSDNYRITMRFAVGTQVGVAGNVQMGE